MSGFDRTLGALSREEMLECARGLLRYLTGVEGTAEADTAALLTASGHGEYGAGFSADGVRRREERDRDLSLAAERAEREGGVRPVERGEYGPGSVSGAGGPEGTLQIPEQELPGEQRRLFGVPAAGRVRASDTDGAADTAPFQGPERRYENAVGARGMEMSRVSDYFRRDSRRYDAGFTRY